MSTIRLQDVIKIYAGPLTVDKAAASKRHLSDQVNRAFAERIEGQSWWRVENYVWMR